MIYGTKALHLNKLGVLYFLPVYRRFYYERRAEYQQQAEEWERLHDGAKNSTAHRYLAPYFQDQAYLNFEARVDEAMVRTADGDTFPLRGTGRTPSESVNELWRVATRKGRKRRGRYGRWVEVEGKPFPYLWANVQNEETGVISWDFYPVSWNEVAKP